MNLKLSPLILTLLGMLCLCLTTPSVAWAGQKFNFNANWKLMVGNDPAGANPKTNDADWQTVTLPYAFNQTEAFSRNCSQLSDTVMWYRKHFVLPQSAKGQNIFVEFEGVRFGARVFINGHELGWAENGITAFGFNLTPYVNYSAENVLAVLVDSDWDYREHVASPSLRDGKPELDDDGNPKLTFSKFQWNNKNFFCNYGGINKNVWLHILPPVYQTLPLYTNLRTVGPYVYAKDYVVQNGLATHATLCAETQVINSTRKPQQVQYRLTVLDKDGQQFAQFMGDVRTIAAADTVLLRAQHAVQNLELWSWGYGYLYTVKSELLVDGQVVDCQDVRTGFRKTEFSNGMFYLNDRVLQLKGYAQRTTNEWPAVGISVPTWMSDYSNSLIAAGNGNLVRWMHVTPSKQDVESLDRMGILQAMPAGDAEKDVTDRRWQQRCDVMRDAIIYNRNNPSIIFYEGGNNQISEAHMADLIALRDKFDPYGGRATGCRNMLDSKLAEYGGEMLYVNKSDTKPVFMMEYNRDEGIRRYWDQWSYPYHIEGEGPLYRGSTAVAYNHNQDGLSVENIVRWNEYWLARPGTGRRVNSGGAKIIFSDSNTHARGEKNYRTSGVVDAMRIPKDSWYALQTMWDGWVDTEAEHTYIIGHWNYTEALTQNSTEWNGHKPIYVCSSADEVELYVNGRSQGLGHRSNTFLFTFDSVRYEPGTIRAVGRKGGREVSSDQKSTVGPVTHLRMRWIGPEDVVGVPTPAEPDPFRADGADIRIAEVEAVDAMGNRHPLAHDLIHFSLMGEGEYLGGLSGVVSDAERAYNKASQAQGFEGIVAEGGNSTDTNGILSPDLMLEAGVIRVLVRSTTKAGSLTLTATPVGTPGQASSLEPQSLSIQTTPCPVANGFYVEPAPKFTPIAANRSLCRPLNLSRGRTPSTPSYVATLKAVPIRNLEAACNQDKLHYLTDGIENGPTNTLHSKWSSDGLLDNAWLKINLVRPAALAQIDLRVDGFRTTSYPLQVFAIVPASDGTTERVLVWEGYTPKCLGNCYLNIPNPVVAQSYEIRMVGEATVKEAFASMTELAAKKNLSTKPSKSTTLSVSEIEVKVRE